jgi:hypothetical protein
MEVEIIYRPIDKWPQPPTRPAYRGSPFKANWNDTIRMLRKEVGNLGAKSAVVMLGLEEKDFRLDGGFRAGVAPKTPGVVVSFTSKFGPLKLPCDACVEWKQNVRAIAYHLEHLRLSGLYGVGRLGEQYTGWRALPPAIITPISPQQASATLAELAGSPEFGSAAYASKTVAANLYRAACKRHHPDSGSNGGEWYRLQAANEALRAYHESRIA